MKKYKTFESCTQFHETFETPKKNWPYKFKCDLYNDFDPNVHVVDFGVVIMHQLSSLREAF